MKSIADQNITELGGRASILSRQRRDHIELERLLRHLSDSPPAEQNRVLIDIYRLVFPHAFAEESVLWPVIRRVLPDGERLTVQVEAEHQEINELVTRLEGLEPGSPEHQRLLDRIVALLRQDVIDEEDELLAGLQARLSQPQLRLLGVAWATVRRIAPTRAHPVVARRPPGNVLSALPLSLIDRLRDRVDATRQRGAGGIGGRALVALSRALAGSARATEELPGMRMGENPVTRVSRRRPTGRSIAVLTAIATVTAAAALARRRHSVA
jgi:hypothetical protein